MLVRAQEGDCYPLGALPVGTQVHCIEVTPGVLFHRIRGAGTFGTILVSSINSQLQQLIFLLLFFFCFEIIFITSF